MIGYFEIRARSDGQFMFNLKADNHEIILISEAYTTKAACMNGIESVKKNASDDDRYRRITTPDGKFRFALAAPNGQVVGGSESYETEDAREDGIQSVKTNAPDAEVKDLADFRPL